MWDSVGHFRGSLNSPEDFRSHVDNGDYCDEANKRIKRLVRRIRVRIGEALEGWRSFCMIKGHSEDYRAVIGGGEDVLQPCVLELLPYLSLPGA